MLFQASVPVTTGEKPATVMLPCEGWLAPAIRLRRVDFPLPDGPTMATISPQRAVRLTESRSTVLLVPAETE